jgi:hypothetical protein
VQYRVDRIYRIDLAKVGHVMIQYGWQDCPQEARAQIETFVSDVRTLHDQPDRRLSAGRWRWAASIPGAAMSICCS